MTEIQTYQIICEIAVNTFYMDFLILNKRQCKQKALVKKLFFFFKNVMASEDCKQSNDTENSVQNSTRMPSVSDSVFLISCQDLGFSYSILLALSGGFSHKTRHIILCS